MAAALRRLALLAAVVAVLAVPAAAVVADQRPDFCKTTSAFNRAAPRRTGCTKQSVTDFCTGMSSACGVATADDLAALRAELAALKALVAAATSSSTPKSAGCAKDLSGWTWLIRPRDAAGSYLATGAGGAVSLTSAGTPATFMALDQSTLGAKPGANSAVMLSGQGMQAVISYLAADFSAGGAPTSGAIVAPADASKPPFEWSLEPNCADGSYLIAAAGPLPADQLAPGTRYLLAAEAGAVKWVKADGGSPPAGAYWTLEQKEQIGKKG